MVELVPLLQSLVWPILLLAMAVWLRKYVVAILGAIVKNIQNGATLSVGPNGLSVAPQALTSTTNAIGVTAEGVGGIKTAERPAVASEIKALAADVTESPFLVHESQVVRERTERRVGLYRIRIALEAYEASELADVTRVTYRLHNSFHERTIATEARDNNFELWLNVYGEFTIIALVERKGHPDIVLARYLDLPGRPPD